MTDQLDRASLVHRLYECEMTKDLDGWLELWADDAVVSFPHAVDPPSWRVSGKNELREVTAKKFAERQTIKVAVETLPLRDPRFVLTKLNVEITMVGTADVIALPILCLFEFGDDGRIAGMQEYLNEAVLADG